jgi:hypothetical protein
LLGRQGYRPKKSRACRCCQHGFLYLVKLNRGQVIVIIRRPKLSTKGFSFLLNYNIVEYVLILDYPTQDVVVFGVF